MRYCFLKIKSCVRHPLFFLKSFLKSTSSKSDIARWSEQENLKESWDSRTIFLGSLIPVGSDVLEFGAGRLVLRDHLAPNCSYQPSDIVDRGNSTIVCDLNVAFPDLPRHYSHTVFSGVLEYLVDIGSTIDALKNHTDVVIASYQTIDRFPDYVSRRLHGWVNHLSHEQFVALFKLHGFSLRDVFSWHLQTIYVFNNDK